MAALLRPLAETDVRTPIPPPELLIALQTPPFVLVPGTFNTRDIGLLGPSVPTPGRGIRPGYAFRSGGLESLHRSADGRAAVSNHPRTDSTTSPAQFLWRC